MGIKIDSVRRIKSAIKIICGNWCSLSELCFAVIAVRISYFVTTITQAVFCPHNRWYTTQEGDRVIIKTVKK